MKRLAGIRACALALAVTAAAAPCGATTTAALTSVPARITTAPADENPETSQAITLILDKCAQAYAQAPAMHAVGTYALVSKTDKKTTYSTARVKVDFLRASNKLAVISTSDNEDYENGFIADGTTVTQYYKNSARYTALPQAPLATYVGNYRHGEINEDFTGNLLMSGTTALLICDDPQYWLHSNVNRYIYEGDDEVAGARCHRIRFNQDPKSIIVLWIDKKSFFIRKLSIIASYDEDYEMVESFEAGDTGTMQVMTWETLSARPADVNSRAFKLAVPKGYPLYVDDYTQPTATPDRGFWGNLVNLAAGSSTEETTWSLNNLEGNLGLVLEEFVNTPTPAVDIDTNRHLDDKADMLGLAFEDGTIKFYTNDGKLSTTVTVPGGITWFAHQDTPTSGPRLIVLDKEYRNLGSYDMAGQRHWNYDLPFARIYTVQTDNVPETGIYLDMGETGLRKLDQHGRVLVATTDHKNPGIIAPAPAGTDALVIDDDGIGLNVLDKNLRETSSFYPDETVLSAWWDGHDKDNPIVTLLESDEGDILLRRYSVKGDTAWSTKIETDVKEDVSAMMMQPRLKIDGQVRECCAVFLTDGRFTITAKDGTIIYRGQVTANNALVERNDGMVMRYFLLGDIDGDGADEIYFPLHTHLMRLKTP